MAKDNKKNASGATGKKTASGATGKPTNKNTPKTASGTTGKPTVKETKAPKEPKGKTIADIYASPAFQNLSPDLQEMYKTIIESYTPEQLASLKFTKAEKRNIRNEAKRLAKEKYKKPLEELTQDYEETLSIDVKKMELEKARAEEDLQSAMENGDIYKAEELKRYNRVLSDSIKTAKAEYELAVIRKNEYLTTKLSQINEDLTTGMGRISEDEITNLRQIERNAKNQMKSLQANMQSMGYTFSSERQEGEQEITEVEGEMKTLTSRDAARAKQDLQTSSARMQSELSTMTAQEVSDLTRKYGYDIRASIQEVEQQIGSEQAIGTAGAIVGQETATEAAVGGQTGEINKEDIEADKAAKTAYDRYLQDLGMNFEASYGTDVFKQQFGENYGSYKPQEQRQETMPGRGTYTAGGWEGSSRKAYQREQERLKQEKRDYRQSTQSALAAMKRWYI